MNAYQFVQKYGPQEAARILEKARGCVSVKLWGKYEFKTDDLKSAVKQHNLEKKNEI
ncbi:hypothetical protein [uncultured Acinetobacter sp.]|uniref:hypothetical protein n=1 Tax=uncultured Acinetobacter sp. TaxID=165433 RepID=UPI0025ECC9D8|nr:hypothetical protein [uncultured Acinetobacter sp.]